MLRIETPIQACTSRGPQLRTRSSHTPACRTDVSLAHSGTAHGHIVTRSCPRPQRANCLLLKKEGTAHKAVGPLLLLGPGPWSPAVTWAPPPTHPHAPPPPPPPSSPFSSPGAPLKPGSLLSVCSISRAWTWPWNFTSLGETGVLAFSSAPPGPLSSMSVGLGGVGSPVWQQGRLREALQRAPNAGKRKSVTSVIPRLEYMRGIS